MEPRAYNKVSNKIMAKPDDISSMTDIEIAKAILNRDEFVTKEYLYKKKYPLFKSIYDHFYSDCLSCKEFIDEIYLVLLRPGKKSGKCQLENYKGGSKFDSWLISVCLFYCYAKHRLKKRMPFYEPLPNSSGTDDDNAGDSNDSIFGSIELDTSGLDREDVEAILNLMPNARYRSIIRMLHIEKKTHSEIAEALGMRKIIYYNKRILAEKQFKEVLRKEERNG